MAKRNKRGGKWWPLERTECHGLSPARGFMEYLVPHPDEVWQNDQYLVAVRRGVQGGPGAPPLVHLAIHRKDWKPVIDWRHKQRIKNEIVGESHEAVELYPAEERLVDNANTCHLWVVGEAQWRWPFGFHIRMVSDGDTEWMRQRAFHQRPEDCGSNSSIQAEAVVSDTELAREAEPPSDEDPVKGV